VGAYWRASPDTDVGLTFKSAIDQTLEGDADFTVPGNVAAVLAETGNAAFQDTGMSAELDTPWVATLGVSHRIGDRFMVAADASRTGWSRFSRILVEYDNAAQPDTLLPQEWRDTWFLSVGGDWKVGEHWTVRGGTAWDETPTVDEFRSPRVPDSDRTWLALGASYTPSDHWRLDLGYAHLFTDGSPVDRVATTGSTLAGEFDFSADVLGTSIHVRF
jgi:long-chain fatty acid transport protein